MRFIGYLVSLLFATEPEQEFIGKIRPQPGPAGPPAEIPYIVTALQQTAHARPEIKILDIYNDTKWTWGGPELRSRQTRARVPSTLRFCLLDGPNSSEMKWAANGTRVTGLVGSAALVINYSPDDPIQDKQVLYGVCLSGILAPSHTVEPLPDGHLAIATTGQSAKDGFHIFDTKTGLVDHPQPVQIIQNFPAIHAMVWDEEEDILWAVGNEKAADGHQGRSHGLLNGYKLSEPGADTFLDAEPVYSYRMPDARTCDVEWGYGTPDGRYWDGPHDLLPLPNQRKFLISSDLDVHTFDLATKKWDCCDSVAAEYLEGFVPVGHRVGVNQEGQQEALPRSDIKSLSLTADGRSLLYNQALWKTYLGRYINVLVDGRKIENVDPGPGGIYRARWFAGVPGWPGAW